MSQWLMKNLNTVSCLQSSREIPKVHVTVGSNVLGKLKKLQSHSLKQTEAFNVVHLHCVSLQTI